MTQEIKTISGGVTAAKEFLASGISTGIKKDKKDLALIYSKVPARVAGVFTLNRIKAAPLLLTKERIKGGIARAIVVNSGNANSCNGPQGMEDALKMTAEVSRLLDIPEERVLVSSTGVIGQPMPMDKIIPGISKAVSKLSIVGGNDAATAIMTTDTVTKETAVAIDLYGTTITIGGMAKGSGMIHPNMATMLGFITTDVTISPGTLQGAIRHAVDRSFNMISVDGDNSTNDMLLVMANGAAGGKELNEEDKDYNTFVKALTKVCTDLAVMVVRDGEGATKLIEAKVINAPTEKDARLAARSITSSSLVKSAVFGEDANWGRILCAVGYSGAEFDQEKVDIFIGDEQVASNGASITFSEERAAQILSKDHVLILVDMKSGTSNATAWGCDLSYDYIKINVSYRS